MVLSWDTRLLSECVADVWRVGAEAFSGLDWVGVFSRNWFYLTDASKENISRPLHRLIKTPAGGHFPAGKTSGLRRHARFTKLACGPNWEKSTLMTARSSNAVRAPKAHTHTHDYVRLFFSPFIHTSCFFFFAYPLTILRFYVVLETTTNIGLLNLG